MQVIEKLQELFSSSSNSENDEQLDSSSISTDNQSSDEDYDEQPAVQVAKKRKLDTIRRALTSEPDMQPPLLTKFEDTIWTSVPVEYKSLMVENLGFPIDDPIQLFLFLFEPSIEYLYQCTSSRQREQHAQSVLQGDATAFVPFTKDEIKAFCGAYLLMDIYKLPGLEMYWGRRGSIITIPHITNAFKWERFQEIRNYLTVDNHDLMAQLLCQQIHKLHNASGHFSVDEQLRKFDGRSSEKVSMPKKPAGTGMNTVVLADGITKLLLWYSRKGLGATKHIELGFMILI